MAKRGRPVQYDEGWCIDAVGRARAATNQVMSKEEWCDYLDCSSYGFDRLREYGFTHGAPFFPVRWEGVCLGVMGDEANVIQYQAEQAAALTNTAEQKHREAQALSYYGDKIKPRLEDGSGPMKLLANTARRIVDAVQRQLPAPSNS